MRREIKEKFCKGQEKLMKEFRKSQEELRELKNRVVKKEEKWNTKKRTNNKH